MSARACSCSSHCTGDALRPSAAPDAAWLPAVGRALGAPVSVLRRRRLDGGYASGGVELLDLDVRGRPRRVVLKNASALEVAAMRALAVVRDVAESQRSALPIAIGPDWLVLPFVDAPAPADAAPIADDVWQLLARVHAHWWGKRPRGLPVVDSAWWTRLCDRMLVAAEGAAARDPHPAYDRAVRALREWRADGRISAALAVLPRTLVHGDPHRGNILGATLIDWGNARVAPPGLDLAVLRAQGAPTPAAYDDLFAQLTDGGLEPMLRPVQVAWADAHVHVQYLGFAADHLGHARVAQMIDNAAAALAALAPALAAAGMGAVG